jgi:hypothetical protein
MRVHGSRLDPNAVNLYSAVAAEKVAFAKHAAEIRKTLSSVASKILGELDADTVSLVEEYPEEYPSPRQGRKKLFSSKKKQSSDEAEGDIAGDAETDVAADVTSDVANGVTNIAADDSEPDDPISVWG